MVKIVKIPWILNLRNDLVFQIQNQIWFIQLYFDDTSVLLFFSNYFIFFMILFISTFYLVFIYFKYFFWIFSLLFLYENLNYEVQNGMSTSCYCEETFHPKCELIFNVPPLHSICTDWTLEPSQSLYHLTCLI